jgi:hypothetical protein
VAREYASFRAFVTEATRVVQRRTLVIMEKVRFDLSDCYCVFSDILCDIFRLCWLSGNLLLRVPSAMVDIDDLAAGGRNYLVCVSVYVLCNLWNNVG